jgi:hypothetical protein|tara:strand:+ start:25 stop:240 length:216 start_codon:yes stop_codon:yes gene_type:complete
MKGEFIVKIGTSFLEFSDYNDIPDEFDHLIKFVLIEPPEPHTQADHDYINTFTDKFQEVFKRGKEDNASSN